jgi:transcription initiation factor IIE alpha subunit
MDTRKKIIDFLEKHPDTDSFEISMLLNLPINEVRNILNELEKEGIIAVLT